MMIAKRFYRDIVLLITTILLGLGTAAKAQFTTNAIFAGNNNGQTNQIWTYLDTSDPGPGWEQKNFNDGAWQSGRALIAGEASAWVVPFRGTIIGLPNNTTNPPTGHARYFRTHFDWPTNPVGVTLNFNARCDDGAIFFLNGTEIFRLRPPPDPISHTAVGSPLPCGGDSDCGDDVFSVSSPALVQGDNVLAVVVYQNANGSSDVVWGTGLSGTLPVPPTITDPNQPSNRIVVANRPTTMTFPVLALPAATYQWFFQAEGAGNFNTVVDGPGFSGATTDSLTISNVATTDAGRYFCTANNPVGSATSRTNVVQVTADTNGPVVVRVSGSATFDKFVVQFDEVLESMTAQDSFNYRINGPNYPPDTNPETAVLSPDGKTVTLNNPNLPHTSDADYTIDISGLADTLNLSMTATQVVVHTWIPTTCGGVLFEAFNAGGGNAVSVLTSHPSFPNSPDFGVRLSTMDIRTATDPANPTFYNSDAREGYGGRLRALFIAPETGPHTFYFASDDGGELWLSTDATPTSRSLIARESAWSNSKQWTTSGGGSILTEGGKRSAPINLQAGKGYYIEALYKEGTGGDNCAVAVQLPSQASPPVDGMGAITGDMLGATAIPPGIAGSVVISQQPTNVVLDAPNSTTFSVVASASGAPFVCYQWQKAEAGGGGVFNDIVGATLPAHTTSFTSVTEDNGDMYRVVINAIGGSATSLVATLTVNPDVIRPKVVKVVPTSATGVSVVFSEPMDVAAATDPLNYVLDGGVGVGGAAPDSGNPTRINLTINPAMTIGTLYTLTMNGPAGGGTLADTSANVINPDPTAITFRAQTYDSNLVNTIRALPTTDKLPLGSLTTRGIMVRFVQVSAAIANDIAIAEQMLDGVYPTNAVSPLPNIAPVQLHHETGMLNYNLAGPTSMDGSLVPDAQYPGFGNAPLAVLDNLAMEAVCYVELRQGITRMVVRSDDNFRLTPALSAEDPGNSFIIGEFNVAGGRGVADTPLIDFIVSEDGLYPMRLVYEQGQGGAAVEWKIQDLETGTYRGVNDPIIVAGGPPSGGSGYLPPCVNKALTVEKSGANLVITWPRSGGGNLFQLQQANVLSNPSSATVWSNVGVVPKTTGNTKSVTVPLSLAANFYRLIRPGSPCTP